jgi:cerevisin
MASPHVAGLAAYLLSLEEGSDITPKQIKDKIIKLSSRGVLDGIPSDTPNLLIFNGADSS